MKTKTITFLGTLLIAAVAIGLLWKENASLRAQITALSLTTPSPAAGETAAPGGRGPVLPLADKLAAQNGVSGAINWMQVLEDPDAVRRAGNFYLFVSSMTPESAQDAAGSLEDMRSRNALSDDEWSHFFLGWGSIDGMAALAYLDSVSENSSARWKNREAALTGWASRDVAGAQAWLANYIENDAQAYVANVVSTRILSLAKDDFFAEDLIKAVCQSMSITDRDAARDYLVAQTVAGHVMNAEAADWIASDWNDADAHDKAATLLSRLPADEAHQEIRTAILRQLVDEHRTTETVELVTRFQAELDPYAVASIASHVASDDSSKAMAWLNSLDRVSPANKTIARANIVSSWAGSDPYAAGSWLLEARRRGEAAPDITASFAKATVGIDPAAAIAWVQTIPDEGLRHNTLLKMAENRVASKDTEALELLKAAGLTDREISGAKLLPSVVDRIPTAQAR